MGPQSQFDREEASIIDAMNSGDISQEEGRKQMRDLHADYRGAAEEAAQEAYDREMNCW
jgi:polyhydroxyalkanoate synthesis regulator phasin